MTTELSLGKIDYENSGKKNCAVTLLITIKTKPATTAPYLDVDLKPITEITELSITGTVRKPDRSDAYTCGQICDTVQEYFGKSRTIRRICEIWQRYHLNGMRAGTRVQMEALAGLKFTTGEFYKLRCEVLAEKHLLDVPIPEESRENFRYMVGADGELPTTYRFGSAWLYEPIPPEVLDELRQLIDSV
jgi:hypothetical protein